MSQFQVVCAVLVRIWVYRNVHDPKNKHGRFDRENGQDLDVLSLMMNILGDGQTDVIKHFALG
jgi:hypothetical protein